jgi:plastocyanin
LPERFSARAVVVALGASALLAAAPAVALGAAPAAAAAPLVIQVDHADPQNQEPFPPFNRLFEYTDFFSRSVTVHPGTVIDFQAQPGSVHVVALARDEAAARRAYPIITPDLGEPPAPGTRLPHLILGTGNFSVTGGSDAGGGTITDDNPKGPPTCGVVQFGQRACTFSGGTDVEVIGPTFAYTPQQVPTVLDQDVVITAPPGVYHYFDMVNPGMSGTLTVVPDGSPVSTQAEVDAAGQAEFARDQAEALALESSLNAAPAPAGAPGHQTFVFRVGAGTQDGHVLIDEILPNRPASVVAGDRVRFVLGATHGLHTVGFAASAFSLPDAFGADCGNGGYQGVPNVFNVAPPAPCLEPGATAVKYIGDPGSAPPGTVLGSLASDPDSGLLAGIGYRTEPTAQSWWVGIGPGTAPGAHSFFDTVHPWMTQTLNVG